jgi:hypothetical protein
MLSAKGIASDTEDHTSRNRVNPKELLIGWRRLLFGSLAFLILFSAYIRLSYVFPENSDDASFVLEALDMLHGNLLLRGWTIPAHTLYTTTTPLYVLGGLVTPNMVLLMHIIPALIYALFVAFCLWVVSLLSPTEDRYLGKAICLLVVGLIPFFYSWDPTHTSSHVITVFCVTGAFYFLAADRAVLFAGLLLILAETSDPFALWIGILPVGLMALRRIAIGARRQGCVFLLIAASSLLISGTFVAAVRRLGGFQPVSSPAQFADLEQIGQNLYLLSWSILHLFGADIFGRALFSFDIVVVLVHLALLMFVVRCIINAVLKPADGPIGTLTLLLATAIFINVAAFTFSTFAASYSFSAVRVLSPVPPFGGLIAALTWRKTGVRKSYILCALPIVGVAYVIPFVRPMFQSTVEPPRMAIEYLKRRHLTEGYASYAEGAILTVLSGGKLAIRQLILEANGSMAVGPVSSERWYEMRDARFCIFGDYGKAMSYPQAAVRIWGLPAEMYTVDGYMLMIWSSPIHLVPAAR